jgi:hypothetical protein
VAGRIDIKELSKLQRDDRGAVGIGREHLIQSRYLDTQVSVDKGSPDVSRGRISEAAKTRFCSENVGSAYTESANQ